MRVDSPRKARASGLADTLAVLLAEVTTALDEALGELSYDQIWSRPLAGRHSIGTLSLHVVQNLAFHAVQCQTGLAGYEPDERFDPWAHSPEETQALQSASGVLPSVSEIRAQLRSVRQSLSAALEGVADEDLALRCDQAPEWFRSHGRTRAESYLRTLCHAQAHLRQIWALRGAMGAAGDDAWPLQHWA